MQGCLSRAEKGVALYPLAVEIRNITAVIFLRYSPRQTLS